MVELLLSSSFVSLVLNWPKPVGGWGSFWADSTLFFWWFSKNWSRNSSDCAPEFMPWACLWFVERLREPVSSMADFSD